MELTNEEIDQLYQFVDSKGVKYLDVQHEIVDHLASQIEDQMSKDESLTFNSSLQQIYSAYPITGFYKEAGSADKLIGSMWRRAMWKMYLSYFISGKAFLTVPLLFFMMALSYHWKPGIVTFSLIGLAYVFYGWYKMRERLPSYTSSKYLLTSVLYEYLMSLVICPILLSDLLFKHLDSGFLITAFCPILILITSRVINVDLPIFLKEELSSRYKHLNLVLD